MFDGLGEFVFNIALVSGVVFSVAICTILRYLFDRSWMLSITIGAVVGLVLGFFASPYIFFLYLDFRGISL